MSEHTASYNCYTYDVDQAFNTHPYFYVRGGINNIPGNATVTSISFEVYCGVSKYNYNADTWMQLHDDYGQFVDIKDTNNTGRNKRTWITITGNDINPQISWNRFNHIMLYGTNKLFVKDTYDATLTLNYTVPDPPPAKLSAPGTPTMSQSNGYYTLSWSAATVSGTSIPGATLQYRVRSVSDGYEMSDWSTARTFTEKTFSDGYSKGYQWEIEARYGNLTSMSDSTNVLKFTYPSLSAPTGVYISPASGTSTTLYWKASSFTQTTGTIQYKIIVNDSVIDTVNSNTFSYAISRNILKNAAPTATIAVQAVGTNLSDTFGGNPLTAKSFSGPFSYVKPLSLTDPGAPSVSQNNNGTYTATWSAAGGSGIVSSSVEYMLWSVSDGEMISDWSTSRTYNGNIGEYGFNYEYKVYARYNDGYDSYESSSYVGSKTFYYPYLTAPSNVSLSKTSGATTTISWSAANLVYTNGSITYEVWIDNSYVNSITGTSYDIPRQSLKAHAPTMSIFVKSIANNLSNTASGNQLIKHSGNVSFTYIIPFTLNSPSAPTLEQNYNGTYTASWAAASGSNINGNNIEYMLWSVSDGLEISSWRKSLNYSANIGEYEYQYEYKVYARYSDGVDTLEVGSNSSSKTYCYPYVTSPTSVSLSSKQGTSTTVSWAASSIQYTSGKISYDVLINNNYIYNTSNLSYSIPRKFLKQYAPNLSISIRAVGSNLSNNAAGATLYNTSSSVAFKYFFNVTLGAPKNLSIVQNNNGTYTLSWSHAPIENASQSDIMYMVRSVADGSSLTNWSKNLTLTDKIGEYGYFFEYKVIARYDDGFDSIETPSDRIGITFVLPSIVAPYLMIDNESGNSFTLTWQPAVLMHTDGNISYDILKNTDFIATTSECTYSFDEMSLMDWPTNPVSLKIRANGLNLSNADAGNLTTDSNIVTFTFIPSTAPGSQIAYYDGSKWILAQVYWYDGKEWRLCYLSYYNGKDWQKI